MHGRAFAPEELHCVFYATRFRRTVDRLGYVRFRHWRVYGERGVAGERAAVWLYGEHLTVEFADEPLAQYRVSYQPDKRHLKAVTDSDLFETPHRSPHLPLWELGDGEWRAVLHLPAYAPRRARPAASLQAPLFPRDLTGEWRRTAMTERGGHRPLLVLVSGAPGSGNSTLARRRHRLIPASTSFPKRHAEPPDEEWPKSSRSNDAV